MDELKGNKENITDVNFKNLFKGLVTAYDCSNPSNVTSYELQDVEKCVEGKIEKSIINTRMQILQKNQVHKRRVHLCPKKNLQTRELWTKRSFREGF